MTTLPHYLRARIHDQITAWHLLVRIRSIAGLPCPACGQSLHGDYGMVGEEYLLRHGAHPYLAPCQVDRDQFLSVASDGPGGDPSELARLMALDRLVILHDEEHSCPTNPLHAIGRYGGPWEPCPTLRMLSLEHADRDDYQPEWRI